MKNTSTTPVTKSKILKWIREATLGMIGYGALLLFSAGKWDWPWGWAYILILSTAMASHVIILVPTNPALLADRAGGARLRPGAKRRDIWLTTTAGLAFVAIMIVAGLDERWGWTGTIPLWVHLASGSLFVTGWAFFLWAMACNPFFFESARIQANHQVASRGSYHLVRHPGYFGNVIGCISQPLLLGSWWALIPAMLTIIAFVIRTGLEDRTLQVELDGYSDYAA